LHYMNSMYSSLLPSHTSCNTNANLSQTQVREKAGELDGVLIRETGSFNDPFHPYFILRALEEQPWMKCVVFGPDSPSIPLLPASPEHSNPIYELFQTFGELGCISSDWGFTLHIDEESLSTASTFLDIGRSFAEEFRVSANISSKVLTVWIDVKYYCSSKGRLALWTPLPCFPENSYPCVFCLDYCSHPHQQSEMFTDH